MPETKMRRGLIVVGLALIALGVVLTLLPTVQSASERIAHGPYHLNEASFNGSISGVSISGAVPVTVAWSATGPVTAIVATCSVALDTAGDCPGTTTVVVNDTHGPSGSATFSVPDGGFLAAYIYASSPAVNGTLTVTVAETTVGLIGVALGAVLLILGVVLRGKGVKGAADLPSSPPAANPPHRDPSVPVRLRRGRTPTNSESRAPPVPGRGARLITLQDSLGL